VEEEVNRGIGKNCGGLDGSDDMKADYWNVTDEQVMEKTGKSKEHWVKVLREFGAEGRKPAESVAHLQEGHGVPRYWARTLTTGFLKGQG
jgi:hypothetical protein